MVGRERLMDAGTLDGACAGALERHLAEVKHIRERFRDVCFGLPRSEPA